MIQSFVWNVLPFYIFYLLIYRWVYLFIFCHLDQTLIYICVLNRCILVVCKLAVSLIYMYMYRRQEEISVILFILSYFIIVYEFHRSNCCFILLLYMYQLGFFPWILLLVDSSNPKNIFKKRNDSLTVDLFWKCWREFSFIRCIIPSIYIYNLDYHLVSTNCRCGFISRACVCFVNKLLCGLYSLFIP